MYIFLYFLQLQFYWFFFFVLKVCVLGKIGMTRQTIWWTGGQMDNIRMCRSWNNHHHYPWVSSALKAESVGSLQVPGKHLHQSIHIFNDEDNISSSIIAKDHSATRSQVLSSFQQVLPLKSSMMLDPLQNNDASARAFRNNNSSYQ